MKTTLKVPVSLPTGHKVASHRVVVGVVRVVLPVDADVQRLPSVLTDPLEAALHRGSFEGGLGGKQ